MPRTRLPSARKQQRRHERADSGWIDTTRAPVWSRCAASVRPASVRGGIASGFGQLTETIVHKNMMMIRYEHAPEGCQHSTHATIDLIQVQHEWHLLPHLFPCNTKLPTTCTPWCTRAHDSHSRVFSSSAAVGQRASDDDWIRVQDIRCRGCKVVTARNPLHGCCSATARKSLYHEPRTTFP